MRVLFTLFVSFVAWAYILKNSSVLDYIPDIGFIDSTDKKKIMLLLCILCSNNNSECPYYFKHCRFKDIELCGYWMFSCYVACSSMEECLHFTRERDRIRIRENTG